MKRTSYILFIIFFFSCGKKGDNPIKFLSHPISVEGEYRSDLVEVHYKDRRTTWHNYTRGELLYVINPRCAFWYEKPDSNSRTCGGSLLGESVWIINSSDVSDDIPNDWCVTIMNVNRIVKVNNTQFTSQVLELVYIKKADLMPEKNIMMSKNDMYECDQEDVRKYFEITSLTHENFFSTPPADQWIRKSMLWAYGGRLEKLSLPLKNSDRKLTFKAVQVGCDADANYAHLETFDNINSYLIYCSFWESNEYRLYDYNNGKLKATLLGYPCISPDNKYIVTFANDEMWGDMGITLYEINSELEIKERKNFYFKNWNPNIETLEMAWINNTEFKVRVNSNGKHFRPEKEDYQYPQEGYLKFKILI